MSSLKELIREAKTKDFWIRLVLAVLAIFCLAVNYNLFLLHNDLVIGGTSGISIIVNEITKMSPSLFIFAFNIAFIILSFIVLGVKSTRKAIIGSLLYPFFVFITAPACAVVAPQIQLDNFLLIVLISGLIFGASNGVIYRTGYSTGGMDVLIEIVSKYCKIPRGTSSFILNFIVILSGGFFFGLSKVVYAVIIIIINSYLVDKIMLGISDSKMFYIHTDKIDEVIDAIKDLDSGYTLLKTEGGYTKAKRNIVMVVVPTGQYFMFKGLITKIDPEAFIVISDCYEVYGGQRKEQFPFI